MSAPPLDNPPAMPTMVSRLPKFGSRPKQDALSNGAQTGPTAATSTRLTNGFYHHPGPAGVNGSLATPPAALKQNGFLRVPTSFSMKWRKEAETQDEGKGGKVGQNRPVKNQYFSQRQQGSWSDAKKPTTTSAGKGRSFSHQGAPSSATQSSIRTHPVSKGGSPGSKPGQTSFGLMNGTKQVLNGLPGPKPRSWSHNDSLRQSFTHSGGTRPSSGPASRSGSPLQKKQPANRSHSSDSLGVTPSVPLTESDRLRSRSLTQVRRQPSPGLTPSSTSSSLSQTSAKSPVTSRTPGGGAKSHGSPVRSGGSIPALLPPSALKKPLLLSHGPASKTSGISYKLSRPSLIKQSRPLRVTTANEHGGDHELQTSRTTSSAETSPESSPEAPETEGLSAEPVSKGEVSIMGETLEDMSLSSSSSLDRNDTSQEYMDDFDNLGNGGVGILLLSAKNDEDDSGLDQSCARFDDDKSAVNGVTKATGLCFLDDGVDWAGLRLNGEQGEHRLTRLPHRRRTSQPDYHEQGGSSLDLSPSDSCGSGGTYMWDEEGLEPLGGAVTSNSINTNSNTTHHIGSFDSDLNSLDILNNLESCDLEDDDLMLDADVPEDGSLHSDGDGISHMAEWRRRQLCWGTQDVHNDNESDFQCYKLTEDPGNKRTDGTRDGDLILDLCSPRSPSLSLGSPGLGLDVEELAEECSAVKSQLEFLQRLLLQEEDADDDTLTTDTLSPETNETSHSSDSQVQSLLQEVQQLREELRSRDRTIAQLTMQLAVPVSATRCHCQEESTGRMDRHTQTSVAERESVASQTPWREHTSSVLHSSSQDDQKPLTDPCSAPPPPPLQAPPPANTCPAQPAPTSAVTEEETDDEKRAKKERKGNRSLLPPQPSKLRLFQSLTPSSAAFTPPPPPKTKAVRQLSHESESGGTAGVKVKTPVLNGLSRLPKPKSG
ncbi:serine-rich coiled-coil domain-containing protein 2-like isoform X2 [Xyrichtys novacula]|uniref:Serine-rich coiled-coil domain-containing protein 2-like isoform X2 n=1 Tax=Xyrichtys novacula TaxID=13765 RepID=A0AAV1H7I1_XYRNO|nr:serine-rich coiled-coil domain-containing protein 2-like isoform X2 [Xyrichtys novacula]